MPIIVERGRGHVLEYFIQAVKQYFCKKQKSAIFILMIKEFFAHDDLSSSGKFFIF
jgi:hypothetical protein